MFGDVLQPTGRAPAPTLGGQPAQRPQPQPKLISSDLDMSLQSLVQNLGISGGGAGHPAQKQSWGSPSKNTARTGGHRGTVRHRPPPPGLADTDAQSDIDSHWPDWRIQRHSQT